MKKIEIEINGQHYPCYQTMGALLRFRKETGKEATEIDAASPTEICTFLYCCVVSACKREERPFTLSLEEFADALTVDDMIDASTSIQEGEGSDEGSKKN